MIDYVALEINNSLIKIAHIVNEEGELLLKVLDSIPTPPESWMVPDSKNAKLLKEAIKTLFYQNKIKTKNVVSIFPEVSTVARLEVDFPMLSGLELNEAIIYEARKYINYPIDKMQLDKIIIKDYKNADKKTLDLLWIATSHASVENIVNLYNDVGLNCLALETIGISLSRLIEYRNTTGIDGARLILNIDEQESNISIELENKLIFSQLVPYGIDNLSKVISNQFKVDINQAREFIFIHGMEKSYASGVLAQSIEMIVQLFVSEIKKAIAFIGSRRDIYIPRSMFITGIGSNISQIDKYMQKTLSIPVFNINPISKLQVNKTLLTGLDMQTVTEYAAVIGLALKTP